MPVTLLLGGARSGKSHRGESLAIAHGGTVHYIATAPRIEGDAEWAARIEAHQVRRPASWITTEVPLALPQAVLDADAPGRVVLVDCLTVWLSNCLLADLNADAVIDHLVECLTSTAGTWFLVSNEVGSGVVPETPLGRSFRDGQGALNRRVAAVADRVELLVAGIPLVVKSPDG